MTKCSFVPIFLALALTFSCKGGEGTSTPEEDTWMLYHAYDVKTNPTGTNRVMLLDKVSWTDDGWPYIGDGHPSETADAPVFRNLLSKR